MDRKVGIVVQIIREEGIISFVNCLTIIGMSYSYDNLGNEHLEELRKLIRNLQV